jgi:hypothetical protein
MTGSRDSLNRHADLVAALCPEFKGAHKHLRLKRTMKDAVFSVLVIAQQLKR